jgi:hypothetical protein
MGILHPICDCTVKNEVKFRLDVVKMASILVKIIFFLVVIALQSPLFAQNAPSAHRSAELKAIVPFVGCPSDGQLGPGEAPRGESKVVAISPKIARRLAYYKAYDGAGILAPRGWHCFNTYGSNGNNLYISPEPISGKTLFSSHWRGFTGAVIQVSEIDTSTSGRFEAARIVARVFPAHMAFADGVISEGIVPASVFPKGPYPSDKLRYLSKEAVEYETPANHNGLGTNSNLRKNTSPIKGVAILNLDNEVLVYAALRLPGSAADLGPIIIREIERVMTQDAN